MMPRDVPLLALTEVRLMQMDSKYFEREPPQPDLWQVIVEGYQIGQPVPIEQAQRIREWLIEGALRDITNLFRRDHG